MDSEVWWALRITWKHQLHGHIDLDLSHQIPTYSWAIWLILRTSSSSDHKPEPLNDLNKVFTSFTSAMSACSCPGKRKSGKSWHWAIRSVSGELKSVLNISLRIFPGMVHFYGEWTNCLPLPISLFKGRDVACTHEELNIYSLMVLENPITCEVNLYWRV